MSSQRKTRDTVGVYNHVKTYVCHVPMSDALRWVANGQAVATRKRGQITAITQLEPPPPPSQAKESPCSISQRHIRINAGVENVSIACEKYVRNRVAGFAKSSWSDRIVEVMV